MFYKVVKFKEDHVGYDNQIVRKTNETVDGLPVVTDGKTEWLVADEEMEELCIGDNVIAPEPNNNDDWNFGDWVGTVEAIKRDTVANVYYAEVSDGDGDVFCIDLNRLKYYNE